MSVFIRFYIFFLFLYFILVPIIPDVLDNLNVSAYKLTNVTSANIFKTKLQDWNKPVFNKSANNSSLLINHHPKIIYSMRSANLANDDYVGVLFASKAVVQLWFNPVARKVIKRLIFSHHYLLFMRSYFLISQVWSLFNSSDRIICTFNIFSV